MLPQNINAVEYNSWMSLIKFIIDSIPSIASEFGFSGTNIEVLPAYPVDLTKFQKPSIIVQKIISNNDSMSLGGFIGEAYDEDNDAEYDVYGRLYDITFQINIDANTNMQMSLLTDMVNELFTRVQDNINYDNIYISLYDFTQDVNNPTEVGNLTIDGNIGVTYTASNESRDYITILRIDLLTVRSVINTNQILIDLSKPFKFNTTIIL